MKYIGADYLVLDYPFSVVLDSNHKSPKIVAASFGYVKHLQRELNLDIEITVLSEIQKAFDDYSNGQFSALHRFKTSQIGSDLAQSVWQKIKTVKPGKPISYKELAKLVNRPTAVRAVASHCGKNQIPLFIPCHRIIKSSGEIGNYAYGETLKLVLLEHEFGKRHTRKSTSH